MISRQRKTALKVWCRTHCRLFWEKKKNLFFRQFLCVSSIETFYPKETLASFSFSTEVETVSRPFPCPSFHGNSLLETPLWFFFLRRSRVLFVSSSSLFKKEVLYCFCFFSCVIVKSSLSGLMKSHTNWRLWRKWLTNHSLSEYKIERRSRLTKQDSLGVWKIFNEGFIPFSSYDGLFLKKRRRQQVTERFKKESPFMQRNPSIMNHVDHKDHRHIFHIFSHKRYTCYSSQA